MLPLLMSKTCAYLGPFGFQGGWLEMPETYVPFADIDGTSNGTSIETFNIRQLEGCRQVGIDSK